MEAARVQVKERKSEPVKEHGRNASRAYSVNTNSPLLTSDSLAVRLDSASSPASLPVAGILQAKLTISQPGDEYEQEADRVAERVMRMPDTTLRLQRKCGGAVAGGGEVGASGSVCEECADKNVRLQRRAVGKAEAEMKAPNIVNDVLRSPGQALDLSTRSFFEPRFGHDFSRVRIHDDTRAAESARAVNAMAYTVGPNLVFGAGYYAPRTNSGRRLIAHELTHFIQQSGESSSQAYNLAESGAVEGGAESASRLHTKMLQRDDAPNVSPDPRSFDDRELAEEYQRVLAKSDPATEVYLFALEAEVNRRAAAAGRACRPRQPNRIQAASVCIRCLAMINIFTTRRVMPLSQRVGPWSPASCRLSTVARSFHTR
ncbi:MAG: DUF4157 domain-containing protein [Pyrinomonadaceae bacterium]